MRGNDGDQDPVPAGRIFEFGRLYRAGFGLDPVTRLRLFCGGDRIALADVFAGYAVYAPATFVIKGVMVLVAYGSYVILSRRIKALPSRILSGTLAELVMVLGYLGFEGVLYGFAPSLVNIPANCVQGIVGIAVGAVLITIFEKQNIIKILK